MIPIFAVGGLIAGSAPPGRAQEPPPAQWLRLDPLPDEMPLTSRESFDGVPPRFVVLTDGSVFVGGRREVLRGSLDKVEMQTFATNLDLVLKSLGKAPPPSTVSWGEGPPRFRFSVLLGSSFRVVVHGALPEPEAPALLPLPEFIRRLAGFRHPSLRLFEPQQFTMIARESTLSGGCRAATGLPSLSQSASATWVVPAAVTRGFPTGAEVSQVCDGSKRYSVVFQPVIPGQR